MRIRLTKWGNSLGIRLPKVFAVALGIKSGDAVQLEVRGQSIVISPQETLDDVLDRITSEHVHKETDTGTIRGNELW